MVISKDQISEVMRELGKRGGEKKSPAKSKATIENLKKARAAKGKRKQSASKRRGVNK